MKERTEVDAWTRQMQAQAREYMRAGMSAEEAEEKACQDIRREIRNSPPIGAR
jgi:hypothetical protein